MKLIRAKNLRKTKESFSGGEKELNGHVQTQSNDSNLTKEPDKNKESSSDTAQKGNVQVQRENTRGSEITEKGKKKIMKIVDLGVDTDCSEPNSKSEEESPEKNYFEPEISVGDAEPESQVQQLMTKEHDVKPRKCEQEK